MLRRLLSTTHRPRIAGVAGIACCAVLVTITSSTWAAWSDTTSNAGNTLDAAADWTAPTVASSTIALSSGAAVGTIRPGGTYHVYANATDDGAPASGTAAVASNVAVLSTGQSDVALAAGSWAVGGTAYSWRSAQLVADAGLVDGAYTYTHSATDSAGNNRVQVDFPVAVDAIAPIATDVQTTGNGDGIAQTGESITFTFSEPLGPASVLAGWDGTASTVVLRLSRTGGTGYLTVRSATAELPLGSVVVGNHLSNNATADFTGSTMVMSGGNVTVTLGTPTGAALSAGQPTTMSWTPTAALTDAVGNALGSTAAVAETGAADRDF